MERAAHAGARGYGDGEGIVGVCGTGGVVLEAGGGAVGKVEGEGAADGGQLLGTVGGL